MSTTMLDRVEALRLLQSAHDARVGFAVDGGPFVVPAKVVVDAQGCIDVSIGDDNEVWNLDGMLVAVEVDGHLVRPGDGWYVVARGVARAIGDRRFAVVPSVVSGRRTGQRRADNWFAGVPAS